MQAADTAREVNLRPEFQRYNLIIHQQGARDTCHVFATVAALEFAASRKLKFGVDLSEEYLNWAANKVTGQYIDGSSYAELALGFKQWGVCQEEQMRYRRAFDPAFQPRNAALASAKEVQKLNFRWHWIKAPGDNGGAQAWGNNGAPANQLSDAHLQSIKNVLRSGWPVCVGRDHNVLVVGFRDDPRQPGGGSVTVRNSNFRAYRTVSYADLKAHSNTALWIDVALDDEDGDKAKK